MQDAEAGEMQRFVLVVQEYFPGTLQFPWRFSGEKETE